MKSCELELEWRGQLYEVTCTEAPLYDPLQVHTSASQVAPEPLTPLTYSFSFPLKHVDKGSFHTYVAGKLPALLGCTFVGGDIEYTRKAVHCSFSFVPLNSDLTPEQQQSLQSLLDKYQTAFSSGSDDIGHVHSPHHVKHTIRVKEGSIPACTSRPMTSFSERERERVH